jgi:hypothetical protein
MPFDSSEPYVDTSSNGSVNPQCYGNLHQFKRKASIQGIVVGARLAVKKGWSVVDRGVNGQPYLWRKNSRSLYVMIDIFNPDLVRRCYSVLSIPEDPYSNDKINGKLIGVGCSDVPDAGWDQAYERARRIAEEYMEKN